MPFCNDWCFIFNRWTEQEFCDLIWDRGGSGLEMRLLYLFWSESTIALGCLLIITAWICLSRVSSGSSCGIRRQIAFNSSAWFCPKSRDLMSREGDLSQDRRWLRWLRIELGTFSQLYSFVSFKINLLLVLTEFSASWPTFEMRSLTLVTTLVLCHLACWLSGSYSKKWGLYTSDFALIPGSLTSEAIYSCNWAGLLRLGLWKPDICLYADTLSMLLL
jgi:hypothetical protein